MNMLKKLLLAFLFSLAVVAVRAQELKVVEFREDPTLTEAVKFPKKDLNGHPCGLILLGFVMPDATFEGDIISSEYKNGEWRIYMVQGANWLNIYTKDYVPLRYEFEGIKSNVTYVMTVVKPAALPGQNERTEQFLVFRMTPNNAILEVNGQTWTVESDGTASKLVKFGTYSYRVQAKNYYTESGTITVSDPDNKQIVSVALKPNFGWIEVKGSSAQGAVVYIDNEKIGVAPCKSGVLKSGEYEVKIDKELYATYTKRVIVKDNETTMLSPELTANFARVTFVVDDDAEIWVNEEKKGIRSWTGDLVSGTYRLECHKDNHQSTITTIDISSDMNGKTVNLSAPIPIYGSLKIESTPSFAKIFIDGKAMGETPQYINEILIGSHEIKLMKDGYSDYVETVVIPKDKRKDVTATLNNIDQVKFDGYKRQAEKALNEGEFDQAIQYYQQACEVYNDDAVRKKIGVVQSIKAGFASVDEAIAQHRFEEAEMRLGQVLTMDPGNAYAVKKQEEIRQLVEVEKRINRQNTVNKFVSIFKGSEEKHANLGGFHIELGPTFGKNDSGSTIGFRNRLYYANYKSFPFYLDCNLNIDVDEYTDAYSSFGLGLGSAMTFTDKFAFNYGAGWEYMIDEEDNFYYMSLGLTYMFSNEKWGGFSYSFDFPISKSDYSFPRHNITYVLGTNGSLYVVAGVGLVVLLLYGAGF